MKKPKRVSRTRLVELQAKALGPRVIWSGLLWMCRQKNYKIGWAKWKFRELFGGWPKPQSPVEPSQAPRELVEWVSRQAKIYRAKRAKELEAEDTGRFEEATSGDLEAVTGLYKSDLMSAADWDAKL